MNINPEFKKWLEQFKGLKPTIAKDYASRTKRLLNLVEIDEEDSIIDIKYKLDKSETFGALTPTVKSQIRRVIPLLLDWYKEQKGKNE